ncbi:MAG: alpha/beta fold hydrolase [Planctomycetota bacterium]
MWALALPLLLLTLPGCHALVAHYAYRPPNRQPILKTLTNPSDEHDQPEGSQALRVELDNGVTLHADFYHPLPLKPGGSHPRAPHPPLALLLHTYAHSARQPALRPWIHAFRQAGYTVLAPDLPGHGRSSPDQPTFGLREAESLVLLLKHLHNNPPKLTDSIRGPAPLQPLVLFGISYGATTALHLAAHPDPPFTPTALITLAPFADPNAAIASYARHAAHPFLLLTPPSWITHAARRTQRKALQHDPPTPLHAAANLPPDLPWLILHGLDDRHAPPHNAHTLFDGRPPNTTLELVPHRDHHSLLLSPETYLIPRVFEFIP